MAETNDDVSSNDRVEYVLTTVDNPFDPFTQFDQWFSFDKQLGYNTPSLLARITVMSDDLSELDQTIAVQDAIDEIVKENVFGVHRCKLSSL